MKRSASTSKTLRRMPQRGKILPITILAGILLTGIFPGPVYAEKSYGGLMKRDLKRGAKNILTSSLEIPLGFQEYHEKAGPPVFRQLAGTAVGAVRTVLRLSSGVLDLFVAFVPGIQQGLSVHPEELF